MSRRWILLVPLLLFLALAGVLYRGLYRDPAQLPSVLIGKPVPAFALSTVQDGRPVTQQDLLGQPALLNVWGSWCPSCRVEHPVLTKLAQQGVRIIGIDYKDSNADAQRWLSELHNPYLLNINDEQGRLGLDLGVYGAPETYLIDRAGIIRYKHVGVVSEQVWREELAARYQALVDEAAP